MKKIIALFISVFSLTAGFAQTFQASIQPLPASGAGITVYVKTPASVTGKVSSLTITVAIPSSVGARPPIAIDNSADTYISYDIYNAVNQTINGVDHYIYNVLGTGDVVPAGASKTFTGGIDIPLVTITFNGNPALSAMIKMANLPDGGTDPNPNSYFGFSIDGADIVNTSAMFYGIPTVSTAVNDGLGYSGTSYAQTVALVPLPIKFLGFDAVKNENNANLYWNVQNESAMTDHYEIQRSFSGYDFTTIGSSLAKNNGNSSNAYTSVDYNLSSLHAPGKIIYYRIKQIDKDGKFIYSEIKWVVLDGKTFDVSVYPNPVVSSGNVYINLVNDDKINITLIDASGKLIQTAALNGIKGFNTYSLNMDKLATGTYIIKVESGGQSKAIPVVKK